MDELMRRMNGVSRWNKMMVGAAGGRRKIMTPTHDNSIQVLHDFNYTHNSSHRIYTS